MLFRAFEPVGQTATLLLLITGLARAFSIGAQNVLVALVAMVYPTGLRGTSIGAAMGFGRLGAILGPIIGGLMIGWNWSIGQMFIAAGIVLVAAAAGSALADRWRSEERRVGKECVGTGRSGGSP